MAGKAGSFLITLTGLPASGKSTLAEKLALEFDTGHGLHSMVVSSDNVRAELPSLSRCFLPEHENAVRRLTLDRVKSALKEGFPVIHDDLNYYRSMRRQLYTMARDLRIAYYLIHLSTPEKECLQLNSARGKTVPDEFIITDAVRFDPPGVVSWDEAFLSINAKDVTHEVLARTAAGIMKKRHDSIPPLEEGGTGPLKQSRLEELDIMSRRIIGQLYKKHGPFNDPGTLRKERLRLVRTAAEHALDDDKAEKLIRQGTQYVMTRNKK